MLSNSGLTVRKGYVYTKAVYRPTLMMNVLHDELELRSSTVVKAEYRGSISSRLLALASHFSAMWFYKSTMERAEIRHSRFVDSTSFRVSAIKESVITDSTFKGATFDETDLEDVDLTGTTFTACKFVQANFTDCDLSGVVFEGCLFDEGCEFENCNLRATSFIRCRPTTKAAKGLITGPTFKSDCVAAGTLFFDSAHLLRTSIMAPSFRGMLMVPEMETAVKNMRGAQDKVVGTTRQSLSNWLSSRGIIYQPAASPPRGALSVTTTEVTNAPDRSLICGWDSEPRTKITYADYKAPDKKAILVGSLSFTEFQV